MHCLPPRWQTWRPLTPAPQDRLPGRCRVCVAGAGIRSPAQTGGSCSDQTSTHSQSRYPPSAPAKACHSPPEPGQNARICHALLHQGAVCLGNSPAWPRHSGTQSPRLGRVRGASKAQEAKWAVGLGGGAACARGRGEAVMSGHHARWAGRCHSRVLQL